MNDNAPTSKINLPAIVWLLPAAVVLLGIAPLPYGYYQFVRIVACGTAAFLAYKDYKTDGKITGWTVLLAITAILFNPFMPIYLTRALWAPIDLVTFILFIMHWRARRQRR